MEINNAIQLKAAIASLETDTEIRKALLIEQFHNTYESFKPANLLKNTFTKLVDTPGIVNDIIGTTVGIGAGVLSKKILVGKPTNIFKRILGTVIQLAVSGAVAKKI